MPKRCIVQPWRMQENSTSKNHWSFYFILHGICNSIKTYLGFLWANTTSRVPTLQMQYTSNIFTAHNDLGIPLSSCLTLRGNRFHSKFKFTSNNKFIFFIIQKQTNGNLLGCLQSRFMKFAEELGIFHATWKKMKFQNVNISSAKFKRSVV